jgi:hypothetical protein
MNQIIKEIPIIYQKEEAYQRALSFLPHNQSNNIDYRIIESQNPDFVLPSEAVLPDTPWRMDIEALENTLSYIYDKLHHSCYMLCVSQTEKRLYKLESKTTAPSFQKMVPVGLKNAQKTSLVKQVNPETLEKPFRVMQCVVKPIRGQASSTTEEYRDLLSLMKLESLSSGVFILNLTDAVILKRRLKDDSIEEPWPIVTGRKLVEPEYQFKYSLPILSTSGQKGYDDIPIPNYDDVQYILENNQNGQKMRDLEKQFITDWDQKKDNRAVFRGGPTGCGLVSNSNQRLYLATRQKKYPEYLDVGIVGDGESKSIKFSHGFVKGPVLGSLNTSANHIDVVSRKTMAEQSNYKYILHVDGNVHAYRLLYTMLTGSLIMRVESVYSGWMDHILEPGVHYIPIKSDFSDLISQIKWCRENDDKCREIAKNGMLLAKKVLTKDYIMGAFKKIMYHVYYKGTCEYVLFFIICTFIDNLLPI